MSVEPVGDVLAEPIDEIGLALIAHCFLSPANVERIRTTARISQRSFSDAALHLGLVNPEAVEEVITIVGIKSRRESGVIETALLRQSESRSMVLRHAGQVTAGKTLSLAHDPDHPRSEQLRALRTALLLLSDAGRQANVLALLSPSAAEGRSQLSADLAIAFSQLGRRTLLVDADLRKPRQHELFSAWSYPGLAQALQLSTQPQVLSVEGLPHLSLLTAGQTLPNPLEMLSDGRFERFLGDWRRQYDFIVIDTPPVTEFSDALSIATFAGRVLICSRVSMTRHTAMKEMLRRLDSTQSRVLGAVMNNF